MSAHPPEIIESEVLAFFNLVLKSLPGVLVGNKCDSEFERQVTRDEGRVLAEDLGCPFLETSAKELINVDGAFFKLVREMRKYSEGHPDDDLIEFRGVGVKGASNGCFSGCVVV